MKFYDEGTEGGTTGDSTPDTTPEPTTTPDPEPQPDLEAQLNATIPDEGGEGGDPPTEPPPQPTFFDQLRDQTGVDLSSKYDSPEEAMKGLVEAQKRLSQRDEYARIGQQVAPHWEQYQQWQQSGAQQANQPGTPDPNAAPESDPNGWWGSPDLVAPDYDPRWEQYVQDGEVTQNAPIDIRNAIENYRGFYSGWGDKLMRRPQEALQPFADFMREAILNEVAEFMYMQQNQQTQEAAYNTVMAKRESDLWQQTPDGRFVEDHEGNRVPTPGGIAYFDVVKNLNGRGLDMDYIDNLAWTAFQTAVGGQPSAPATATTAPSAGAPGTYAAPTAAAQPTGNIDPTEIQPGESLVDALMRTVPD